MDIFYWSMQKTISFQIICSISNKWKNCFCLLLNVLGLMLLDRRKLFTEPLSSEFETSIEKYEEIQTTNY